MNIVPQRLTPISGGQRHRKGITLVEVTMSTLLTAFVLVAALQSVAGSTMAWRSSERLHDGMSLAQQLMAEIVQQKYQEPGISLFGLDVPESSLNRAWWDDVDDYDGLNDSPPHDKNGNVLAGYTDWRRTVTVEYVQALRPQNNAVSDEGLKRITVTVTDSLGRNTILVALRSKYGGLEQPPTADVTLHTGVSSEIQIGSSTKIENGVSFTNHARDR